MCINHHRQFVMYIWTNTDAQLLLRTISVTESNHSKCVFTSQPNAIQLTSCSTVATKFYRRIQLPATHTAIFSNSSANIHLQTSGLLQKPWRIDFAATFRAEILVTLNRLATFLTSGISERTKNLVKILRVHVSSN